METKAICAGLLPLGLVGLASLRLLAAEPRVIEFASGVTRLDAPFVLGPEDSGTILRGAADGSSVVSGARELKGLVFARPFADIGLRCAEGDATIRDNIFLSGERRDAKPTFEWKGGRVREFDGPFEFSAFGVTPETVGIVVVVPPAGTPFEAGDLIPDVTRETLPVIPLKGGVEVVRTQRRLVLRDFHD